MARFCSNCGAELAAGAKFCAECGHPVTAARRGKAAAASEPEPDPGPVAAGSHEPEPAKSDRTALFVILGIFVAAIVGAVVWYGVREPAPGAIAATAEPDDTRPQEWFDSYTDKFLSGEVEMLAIGEARVRTFPTVEGSQVSETLSPGTLVSGRLVEGGDPETRWLRVQGGGYVWEGNLVDPDTITAYGMDGLVAGSPHASLSDRLRSEGAYGGSGYEWDGYECEIYTSLDGLVWAMVERGTVTRFQTDNPRLRTAAGIHVGSTERELRNAYGNQLQSEENPYSGTDYFLWASKTRGIKFQVEEGKVTSITSGTESIRYVEGCL